MLTTRAHLQKSVSLSFTGTQWASLYSAAKDAELSGRPEDSACPRKLVIELSDVICSGLYSSESITLILLTRMALTPMKNLLVRCRATLDQSRPSLYRRAACFWQLLTSTSDKNDQALPLTMHTLAGKAISGHRQNYDLCSKFGICHEPNVRSCCTSAKNANSA